MLVKVQVEENDFARNCIFTFMYLFNGDLERYDADDDDNAGDDIHPESCGSIDRSGSPRPHRARQSG